MLGIVPIFLKMKIRLFVESQLLVQSLCPFPPRKSPQFVAGFARFAPCGRNEGECFAETAKVAAPGAAVAEVPT